MSDVQSPPGATTGRRWQALALLAPFQFIFGLIYSWGAMAPAIHAQSGWSYARLDLAFSLTPLALLPAVILAGHNLGRMSPKTMLAAALGLFTIGSGLGLVSHAPLPFMLGYSILALGVGAGLSTASCIALVSRWYPGQRGTLGGALLALYGMSSAVSAPLFEALNVRIGWRAALAALVGAYALIGWLAWFRLPPSPARTARTTAQVPLWRMLGYRRLRWALAGVLLAAPLGSVSFSTIGHFSQSLGFGSQFAVVAVSLMAFGNGAGRFGFGVLADTRSAHFSRASVLVLNAAAALLLMLVMHGIDRRLLLIYPLLIGLAFGGMAGKLPALSADVVEPDHAESAFGLLFGTFALAAFLGPLVSAAWGMHAALTALSVCAVSGGLLVTFESGLGGRSGAGELR